MPDTWENALQAYSYSVDLSEFEDADKYSGWFQRDDSPLNGTLKETIIFEDRFRELAPHHLEAWYEVVYWKTYSQKRLRNSATQRAIKRIEYSVNFSKYVTDLKNNPEVTTDQRDSLKYALTGSSSSYDWNDFQHGKITSERLWSLCLEYTKDASKDTFNAFRKMLVKGKMVAAAATFPAFLAPDSFPMIDKQIAKWARKNGDLHSYGIDGPILATYASLGNNVLKQAGRDWVFVESWIDWCRLHRENTD